MHLAHAAPQPDGSFREHYLDTHLREVAALAAEFAESFKAQDVARLAGLWHDLGKYRPAFQAYLKRASGYEPDAHVEGVSGRVTHSGAGALLAIRRFKEPGRILAYLIAGHHAGLSDWHGGLRERLASPDTGEELAQARRAGPPRKALSWTCVRQIRSRRPSPRRSAQQPDGNSQQGSLCEPDYGVRCTDLIREPDDNRHLAAPGLMSGRDCWVSAASSRNVLA